MEIPVKTATAKSAQRFPELLTVLPQSLAWYELEWYFQTAQPLNRLCTELIQILQ